MHAVVSHYEGCRSSNPLPPSSSTRIYREHYDGVAGARFAGYNAYKTTAAHGLEPITAVSELQASFLISGNAAD
jgi:hypothetical protein